jgi:hypothetical protein
VAAPTADELDAALALIAQTHPDADVIAKGVADAHAVRRSDGVELYLSADDRGRLAPGDDYVTWVVTFRGGEPVAVSSFSSRACSAPG